MATDTPPVKQGWLGLIKRAGRVEPRYFALYQDRIDYFQHGGDLEDGKDPRGRVAIPEIRECVETDSGFVLRLSGDKNIDVKAEDDQDLPGWLAALRPFLEKDSGPAVAETAAPVAPPAAPPVSQPPEPATAQASAGHAASKRAATGAAGDHEDKMATATAKQRVNEKKAKDDEAAREQLQHTLHELKKKLTAAAHLNGIVDWVGVFRPYDRDNSGEIDFDEFLKAVRRCAKVTSQQMGDKDLNILFGASEHDQSGLVNYKTFATWLQADGTSHLVGLSVQNMASQRVNQKKMKAAELAKAEKANALMVVKRKLKAAAFHDGKTDWQKLFALIDKNRSGNIGWDEFRNAIRKSAKTSADALSDKELRALYNELDADGSGSIESSEFMIWLDPDAAEKEEAAAPQAEASPGLVHSGTLIMQRKGKEEPRHFVLTSERLEYYNSASDVTNKEPPRGLILLVDIQHTTIEEANMRFTVQLKENSRTLGLVAKDGADFGAWQGAFCKALGSDQILGLPEAPAAAPEAPGAAPASEPPEPAIVKPSGAVHNGPLTLESSGGSEEARYIVLYPDKLHIFMEAAELQRDATPQLALPKEDVEDLDIQETHLRFKLEHASGILTLKAADQTSFGSWLEAFGQVFGGGDEEEQESQLPHRTQLQHVDATPAQGAAKAALVWQGMLEVQSGGSWAWKYFALYEDSLASFGTASDMANGAAPEGSIPLTQVQDVSVVSKGFIFHFETFNLAFNVSTEPGVLAGWVAALHRVLQFDDAPLPSVVAPPSRGGAAGVNGTPKSIATTASPSRLLVQGTMCVEELGTSSMMLALLFGDRIDFYQDLFLQFDAGQKPKAQILLAEVSDCSVVGHGFSLELPGGRSVALGAPDSKSFEEWRGALEELRLLSSAAARPKPTSNSTSSSNGLGQSSASTNVLHQGPLEILLDGPSGRPPPQAQLQHFCLYADRLDHFNSTTDALKGLPPRGQVKLADVLGFKVLHHGFVLRLVERSIELRVVGQADLDVWLRCFRSALTEVSKQKKKVASQQPAAGAANHVGTPVFGRAELGAGFTSWPSSRLQSLSMHYPTAAWPAPPGFEAELRQVLLSTRGSSLQQPGGRLVRLRRDNIGPGILADLLLSWEVLEDMRQKPLSGFTVMGHRCVQMTLGDAAEATDVKEPAKAGKPAVMSPEIIYQGPIGIQHNGALASKYFVLYRDRLDYFDSSQDAALGQRPKGRISLTDVTSYEAYGNGFILRLGGRSVGLHLAEDEEAWSRHLSSALKESPGGGPKRQAGRPLQPTAATGARQPASSRSQRTLTPPRRPASAPRCAQPRGGAAGTPPPRSRRSPDSMLSTSSASASYMRANTDSWVEVKRCETRHDVDGRRWENRTVADNVSITQKDTDRWLRRDASPVSTKITGDRMEQRTGLHAFRKECTPKINESPKGRTLTLSRSQPEITGKVNEAGRIVRLPDGPDRITIPRKVGEMGGGGEPANHHAAPERAPMAARWH